MTPKDSANMDQFGEAIKDHFCTMLWVFFSGCLEKGFSREEALILAKPLAKNMAYSLCPRKRNLDGLDDET